MCRFAETIRRQKISLGGGIKSSLAVGRGETAKILCHMRRNESKFRASCREKKKGFWESKSADRRCRLGGICRQADLMLDFVKGKVLRSRRMRNSQSDSVLSNFAKHCLVSVHLPAFALQISAPAIFFLHYRESALRTLLATFAR